MRGSAAASAFWARFWAATKTGGAVAASVSRTRRLRFSVPATTCPTLIWHSPRRSSVVGA